MLHIVLHEPEIPSNTGNIGRTCLCLGAALHLIDPLGFTLNEKNLKRAGLDYWDRLTLFRWRTYEEFLEAHPGAQIWYATTKAHQLYTDVSYGEECYLMFGKESAGIPEEILVKNEEHCVRLPMMPGERSLNLSNAAAIMAYEASRQNGFPGMLREGELHRLSWRE